MSPITKVLSVVQTFVVLGAVGIIVFTRLSTRTSHAPVSRPLMAPIDGKVVERAKSWTVLISNEGFEQKFRGTGMLIDSRHVLTAGHMVARNGNEMWIYVYPGRKVVHGTAISEDPHNDLAILELDEKVELPTYATFQEDHHDGEPIIIIGNILGGMKWYISYGIISGEWFGYILMDGTMTHGDSGGPWINGKGEVVGMSDWQLGDEEPESAIKGGVSAKAMRAFISARKTPAMPIVDTYTVKQSDPTQKVYK